jgi:hypothetical protein
MKETIRKNWLVYTLLVVTVVLLVGIAYMVYTGPSVYEEENMVNTPSTRSNSGNRLNRACLLERLSKAEISEIQKEYQDTGTLTSESLEKIRPCLNR